MSNKSIYKRIDIVKSFVEETELQPPEKTILNLLQGSLSGMKMLDVGVGGGRTTLHFANLAKEYVGIDYSEEMVAACRKRFSKYSNDISFKVCDVRSMGIFKDSVFDFILFSFNGIDYISHNDRAKAFRELQRVGRPGGYFCFSTHNIWSIYKIFEFKHQLSLHPKETVKKIFQWFLLKFVYNKDINIKKLKNSQYAIFNDGAHNFKLQTYYIKPIEQIKQLSSCFKEIRIFSLKNGKEIKSEIELNSIDDDWLYYLCVIKSS